MVRSSKRRRRLVIGDAITASTVVGQLAVTIRVVRFIVCTLSIAGLLTACGKSVDEERQNVGPNETSVCGTLHIDIIPGPAAPGIVLVDGSEHITRLVRGDQYAGMEDNDLRGFLDGTYKYGWNQVSQSHLRLGRRGSSPRFGEYELFRNLQRWGELPIPREVDRLEASVTLSLESGPSHPVDIAVYAVFKDWNPGSGGVDRNNNSSPAPGEVWWVEAKSDAVPWSLAGAGHASDTDPDADTAAEPLAILRYSPGDTEIVFASSRLADYVETRIHNGAPLLLLYKLVDPYEDTIGSVLEIWSANFGIESSVLRPQLQIRWRPAHAMMSNKVQLILEAGRHVDLPAYAMPEGGQLATTFHHADQSGAASACGRAPYLEYRPVGGDLAWRALPPVAEMTDGSSIELRVTAAERPVALGENFTATIRDTWTPAGAPEDQPVYWTFWAPDGSQTDIEADYIGDYSWRTQLPVNMLGRWAFRWRHALSGEEVTSPVQHFDVVAWELPQVVRGLHDLVSDIELSGVDPRSHAMRPFELRFMRLQRSAITLAVDTDAATMAGIMSLIRSVRELLSGRPVPVANDPEPREAGSE